MLYGFYRGRGGGRGRIGGGMGFGFRGSSPSWPYVGRGRGGLPRCGYYAGNAIAPVPYRSETPYYYPEAAAPAGVGVDRSAPAHLSREEELSYMKNRAESIKEQLETIESRMRDLEKGES